MTFEMRSVAADTGAAGFRVGGFDLYPGRNCDAARVFFGLSHRETEFLMWLASGLTKREIAARMGVTASTTDTFRRRAYSKLGVGSGAAASAILSTYLAGAQVDPVARTSGD